MKHRIGVAREEIKSGDLVELDLETGEVSRAEEITEIAPFFRVERWGVWFTSRARVRAEPGMEGTKVQVTAFGERQVLRDLETFHAELARVIKELKKRSGHGEEA